MYKRKKHFIIQKDILIFSNTPKERSVSLSSSFKWPMFISKGYLKYWKSMILQTKTLMVDYNECLNVENIDLEYFKIYSKLYFSAITIHETRAIIKKASLNQLS